MSKNDRKHFTEYRDQTRVKHEIVRKYIKGFFHVLGSWHDKLFYIDGFAGRGTYDDPKLGGYVDGSPLQALKVIAENSDLANKVRSVFVEDDSENFSRLNQEVKLFYSQNSNINKPVVLQGTFADKLTELLDLIDGLNGSIAQGNRILIECLYW
jgi:three-Cys-motif partner protein